MKVGKIILHPSSFIPHPCKKGPIAIHHPRGAGIGVALADKGFRALPIGQGEMMRDGEDAVIVGVGPLLYDAIKAAEDLEREGISVAVANARFVKPLDAALLDALAARFKFIITLEEGTINGGFGSAVAEFYAERFPFFILHPSSPHPFAIGLPDQFIEHGAPAGLLADVGLTREGIRDKVRQCVRAGRVEKVIV